MNDENRLQLQKGDSIRLFRSQDSWDEWEITGVVGAGGFAVCYEAACGNKSGRLKEFYPWEYGKQIRMKRTDSGQLLPVKQEKAKEFYGLCDDFMEAYLKLEKAKKNDKDNEVLNNFIPPCEILYGLEKDGTRGSVYIWTPDDKKGIGFDTYLAQIHKNPCENGWRNLYQIICILYTLTDCVRALHQAGFLHLDLKPSNFLIPYTGGKEVNTGTISLFDVNTLYDIDQPIPRFAGSKGTQAPEVRRGRADNRSDIYSIGAMLFYGVIIDDRDPEGYYYDDYYPFLEHLANHSVLIANSDICGDRYVTYWMITLLKKCLARKPEERYGSCEELLKDLEGLRTFLEYRAAENALDKIMEEAGCEADFAGNRKKVGTSAEETKNFWFRTEIAVPFSTATADYKKLELNQGCSIGIDFSYDVVRVAFGKEKESFFLPLEEDGDIELPVVVCEKDGKILNGKKAKEASELAVSVLSLVQKGQSLLAGDKHYHVSELIELFFAKIKKAAEPYCKGAEEITAVLSLPVDLDREEIELICRSAAFCGIHIRRVIDRTTAFAVAALQRMGKIERERNFLACLFEGERFVASSFEKISDLDIDTMKKFCTLHEREIVSGYKDENCLKVLDDMISIRYKENPMVVLFPFEYRNTLFEKQMEQRGFTLLLAEGEVQPCYGGMLLNDMMMLFHPEIPATYGASPFDVDMIVDGKIAHTLIRKGIGLYLHKKEIMIDMPDTEEMTEIRFVRRTFGCLEKVIAAVNIPGSRYLHRRLCIHTKLEPNFHLHFYMEVTAETV